MTGLINRLTNWFTASEHRSKRRKVASQLKTIAPIALVSATYGYISHAKEIFPYPLVQMIQEGQRGVETMLGWRFDWYYQPMEGNPPETKIYQPARMQPGLTLLSGLSTRDRTEVKIIDAQGKVAQAWLLDWWKLWPNATHVPEGRFEGPPGPVVHGMMLASNGDILVNMENAGLMRIDPCGKVVWKNSELVHHSMFEESDGNYWAASMLRHETADPGLPAFAPPFEEATFIKFSPDGKIIKKWRVSDLLKQNGLGYWLYLPFTQDAQLSITMDPLHLNDVEVFPATMAPGVFRPGDVMLSFRNISTVVVMDSETGKFKHIFNGPFIRQHDPDFIDGNTIILFDNNTPSEGAAVPSSRIIELSADGRPFRILYEGTRDHPFFSFVMGKQQALPNGNLLIAEATHGRAFEIDPQGNLVWEYHNIYRKGRSAVLTEATRLAPRYDAAFFANARARCGG